LVRVRVRVRVRSDKDKVYIEWRIKSDVSTDIIVKVRVRVS
jgi:hypothetical protein